MLARLGWLPQAARPWTRLTSTSAGGGSNLGIVWREFVHQVLPRPALYINGEFIDTQDSLDVVSPRDGRVVTMIANAEQSHVEAAVAAARHVIDDFHGPWRSSTPEQRSGYLRELAVLLNRQKARFAALESLDCGKPLAEAEADIGFCVEILEYYAAIGPETLKPILLETKDPAFTSRVTKEPAGVVGCITPWNYPLMQSINKLAPAIAAGCAIVLKPSPLASLSNIAFCELLDETKIPPGVINVITGGPPTGSAEASSALVEHHGLDRLSFTGSSITGKALLHTSAEVIRPTSLELGGKGAIIVFDDVDIDTTVDWIMVGIFLTTGQVCSATSRLLLHQSVYDQIMSRLLERTESIVVGDPFERQSVMGPLVSAKQRDSVLAAIATAEREGCTVLTGGTLAPVLPDHLAGGSYVRPTILGDVPVGSAVWKEEIFGPVLSVRAFHDEQEAINLANSSPYGLAHAVCTDDRARCSRVAAQLRAGVVYENCSQVGFVTTPFGGSKQSGFGWEWGEAGLDEYVQKKTITTAAGPESSWSWYAK